MPIAVIVLDHDPLLRIADVAVRWETLAIAAGILAALLVAGIGARSMDLRLDDLVFIALGVVPGAVVGGRLGYVLLHPDFFAANPGAILDPGIGSLELGLGVVGGAVTGGTVAALLEGWIGRWFHAASLPLLIVLGFGKLANVLGGRGQGLPWDGDWATAYAGPGPWASLAPEVPSHPSQAYEGIAALAALIVLMGILAVPAGRRPDGRSFLVALGLWAALRLVVAATWRDPVVLGPLRAGQLIDLAIVAGCIAGLVALLTRDRASARLAATG